VLYCAVVSSLKNITSTKIVNIKTLIYINTKEIGLVVKVNFVIIKVIRE